MNQDLTRITEVTEFLKSLAGHSYSIASVLHCVFCLNKELGVDFCEYIREKVEND